MGTVEIAEEVWREWESLREQEEPTVMLRFEPIVDPIEAAHAMRECVMQVTDAFDARLEASGDESSVGEWGWLRVADGVLVNVIETDILEQILREIADELERRGITGTFRLREKAPAVRPPTYADHMECRLRVSGQRMHRGTHHYQWQPSADAQAACLIAADEWCRRQPGAICSIRKDMFGPVPVSYEEPLADRLIDAAHDDMAIDLACVSGEDFRAVSARRYSGGISLVAGGPSIRDGAWRMALGEFLELLGEVAEVVVYAHIRRGWSAAEALVSHALPSDWPRRPDYAPRGRGFTAQAFEDLYAPDAFGVQLLGAGYRGRVPAHRSWRQRPIADGATLLEHIDLSAWFDGAFVPQGTRASADQGPVPAILTSARAELAPVLYTPGVLHRAGFADEPGL